MRLRRSIFGAVLAFVGLAPVLPAQTGSRWPTVLVSGGVASHYQGTRHLGSPGLSGALGLQRRAASTLAVRLEAQGFSYAAQTGEGPPAPKSVVALAAIAVWQPVRVAPLYGIAGGAVLRETASRREHSAAGGVVGLGVHVARFVALEGHYLHTVRPFGSARGLLATRLVVGF